MKKIISAFVFCTTSLIWAGPERFDHLQDYKLKKVTKIGPSEERVYRDGKEIASANFTYNEKGQLSRIDYQENQKPNGYTLFEYSAQGLKKETSFDSEGLISEQIEYEYNKKDQIVGYKGRDLKLNQTVSWHFEIQDNQIVSGKRILDKNLTEYFKISLNGNGNFTQTLFDAKGEKEGSIEHIFENKRIKKRIRHSNIGSHEIIYSHNVDGMMENMKFYQNKNGKLILQKEHIFSYASAKNNSTAASARGTGMN